MPLLGISLTQTTLVSPKKCQLGMGVYPQLFSSGTGGLLSLPIIVSFFLFYGTPSDVNSPTQPTVRAKSGCRNKHTPDFGQRSLLKLPLVYRKL